MYQVLGYETIDQWFKSSSWPIFFFIFPSVFAILVLFVLQNEKLPFLVPALESARKYHNNYSTTSATISSVHMNLV
jgi:hypothetical protein